MRRCHCACAAPAPRPTCLPRARAADVERRDAGNPLQDREDDIAIGLSCTAFEDPAWVAKYRPEWPKNLVEELKTFTSEVKQPEYPLPKKGTPPTRGEVEF